MPKPALLAMGLLSKQPQSSTIFKRYGNHRGTKPFTQREIMHAVALYWTPELPKRWIAWQFRDCERKPEDIMRTIRKWAYHPYYRDKWQHLGRKNLEFIGLDEVQAFYDRYPPGNRSIPSWALIVINDLHKRGETKVGIARRFGLNRHTVRIAILNRTIFEPNGRARSPGVAAMANNGSKEIVVPKGVIRERKKIREYNRKWRKKRKRKCSRKSGAASPKSKSVKPPT